MNFPRQLFIPLNFIIPKHRKWVYIMPHTNCRTDNYDLLNPWSDNALTIVRTIMEDRDSKIERIYLETYSRERLELLNTFINSHNKSKCKIILILSYTLAEEDTPSTVRRFANMIKRYRCRLWISDTGFCYYQDKTKRQVHICLNYSTPFKLGYVNRVNNFSKIDHYVETSLFTSMVHASEFKIKLSNCLPIGFARNDNLLKAHNTDSIKEWLKTYHAENKKIILYVPTYRDYRDAYSPKRNILGLSDNNELSEFLSKINAILIVKFHPYQDVQCFVYDSNIIKYEKSFSFSLYDLLSISDLLISDYSSVVHDYMLTGKPIIHDFFDRAKYDESRGFAFDPVENACPGTIVEDWETMKKAILDALNGDYDIVKYNYVGELFHKFKSGAIGRTMAFIDSII